ncbi:hypothetical protein DRQ53_11420 [bacterium]|nr:MAG: hypothetical protein DRQ32_06000 [bacterium]RKZ14472.1 MAG: hypothetical protein DRQ53_11420 [bacterium]
MSTKPMFWLDRDGTIVDDPGYLKDPGQLRLLPGAAAAVARLNAMGTVVLVTNQSGIGRGYMERSDVDAVHAALAEQLASVGAHIDHIELCPHRPDEACDCRKPQSGMILRARAAMGSLGPEYMIGDKRADLGLARATGCTSILVRTGDGLETESALRGSGELDTLCDHVADDLAGAASWIIESGDAR